MPSYPVSLDKYINKCIIEIEKKALSQILKICENKEDKIKAKKVLSGLFILIMTAMFQTGFSQDDPTVKVNVEKGDCLIHICNKYLEKPTQWKKIAAINKLKNPNVILPRQTILIPASMMKGTPVAGTVTFLQGSADSKGPGEESWSPLTVGYKIEEGCAVRTGQESSVEIRFEDGNTFLLKPDTTIGLQTARKSGDDYSKYKLSLQVGKLISNVQKSTGKESKVQIEAPTAVLGVRGTVFRTYVAPDGTSQVEVIEGEVYVEGTKQSVDVKQGEGTIIYRGKTPLAPRKLLAAPSLSTAPCPTYKKLPVRLSFEEIKDASSYRIVLARDSEIKNIVKDEIINKTSVFEFSDIDDGTYFLQSNSIDEIGLEGLPSDPVKIHVRVNPAPPFVETPVDKSEYKSRSLKCSWLRVRDAKLYHVQIAEDAEFKKIVKEQKDIAETECNTGTLDYNTYYFRVSSKAADNYQGEWSDTLSFAFIPPPPSLSVEPPVMDKNSIKIRWQDLGKDVRYRFQMSRNEDFRDIALETMVDIPENTFQRPKQAGTYYVRISGIDSAGREGAFSTPQSFEVKRRFSIFGIAGAAAGLLLLFGL